MSRKGEQWRAEIELRTVDGTSRGSRQVESSAGNCTSLAAAAGLAIALMIEPLLLVEPAAIAPAPPSTASRRPVPVPIERPVATLAAPPPPRRPEQTLALGAVGFAGVLPRFAVGPTLVGSVRVIDRFYVLLAASLLPEQRQREAGADVGFGMTLGSIGGCFRLPLAERLAIASCAGLLLGSMQVVVRTPEPVSAGSRVWTAASTGLRLSWSASRFDVALGIDALGRFQRRDHLIESVDPPSSRSIFSEPALAAAGSLLVGVSY